MSGRTALLANDYLCMCKESSESCARPARTTAPAVGDGVKRDSRIMAPRQRLTTQHSHEELSSTSTTLQVEESSKPLVESHRAQDPTEVAREQHDFFNLVALVFVVAATVINWDFSQILNGPEAAWVGDYFYLNLATTVCYFLADLIWVARVPICVKSPDVIIKHHFVAIAYLSAPIFWPEYRWFMGACLSVEINTWFLIARRVVYKRREQMPAFVQDVVSQLFYLSWIVIRMYVYPLIMYIFCRMAYEEIVKTGIFWHWPMMFMPVHFFLCVLNLKWSYDLFKPIILRWFGSRKEETGVASGL